MEILQSRRGHYDPEILDALVSENLNLKEGYIVRSVSLQELAPGMILEDNITNFRGLVLMTWGQEITEVLKMRILQCEHVREPIRVLAPVE